jgi:hypothetical protein
MTPMNADENPGDLIDFVLLHLRSSASSADRFPVFVLCQPMQDVGSYRGRFRSGLHGSVEMGAECQKLLTVNGGKTIGSY